MNSRDSGGVALGCLAIIGLIALSLVISSLLIWWLWGLIIPVIFPGAVAASLLPGRLAFEQAFKMSVFFNFISLGTLSGVINFNSELDGCSGAIVTIIVSWIVRLVLVVIGGLLVSLIWSWVVPDIMSGAVALGVLPAQLSWWHSMLLCLLMGILGLGSNIKSSKKSD